MADKEQPKEPEKPVYQRDLTAKEPKAPEAPAKPVKPKIKPRKVFVPKKVDYLSDKALEHRVRHILVSSIEAAEMFRQSILDFKNELAAQEADDPDKELVDRHKVENFFSRVAKKYSICITRKIGGDLGWVREGMKIPEDLMTPDLLEAILKAERYTVPEPIKTRLGQHLILICESRPYVEKEQVPEAAPPPKSIPGVPH